MARTRETARRSTGRRARELTPLTQPPHSTRVLRSHTAAQAAQASTAVGRKLRRRLDPWAPKRKVNSNPRPRPPPPTHFTCRICTDEHTTDQFPQWVPAKRGRYSKPWDVPFACIAHLARNPRYRKVDPVCKNCIGHIMSARLDDVGARKVTGCVDPACPTEWSWEYIMRYMPVGESLEKYNIEMLEVWKQDSIPKLVQCISPECNAIGLPDTTSPGYPQVTCYDCGFRACAQCLVPWHKDSTCAEHAAKNINEQMTDPEKDTLKLMQTKDGKRCPNCYLVIEKDGGCDSMFCLGCKKYFNWATAASAVPGSTKAQPFIHGNPYWHIHNASVICEMDALDAGGTTPALHLAAAAA